MEVVLIFPYGDDVEEIHFLGRYYTATEFDLVGHCIYIINMGFFYVLKLFFPQIFVISMADVIEGSISCPSIAKSGEGDFGMKRGR